MYYSSSIAWTNFFAFYLLVESFRNMLTGTRNRHFTERLFYADSLPQYATVCYNGNIAALRIDQMDSVFTFAYTYDACNRLKTSNRLTGYGAMFSESFDYDDAGNISSLKRYMDSRLVDDLSYHYGTDGNQVLSITDSGADADLYDVAEYHHAETAADTTMRYDANGNLIFDADRGISAIRYNILNLPDTIQFSNGNQIVNLYDAAGRKYRSVTYTLPVTAVTPIYEIAHYNFSTDTIHFDVTEYTGNIERRYSRTDTTQRVFNTIGYYTDSTYYHYIKDHLGNICAVVNSMADTTIQSTIYYASGVPMVQSWGKDRQPYLYNGKEFIEAHDYNTYDYGFRGYYATTGRFTSVDPLAEQTPWQSPYAYAGNDFTNAIDWMGLSGMVGYRSSGSSCQYIVYDGYTGVILDYDLDDEDRGVYVYYGDEWEIGGDRTNLTFIGIHKKGLNLLDIMESGGTINLKSCMESYSCVSQEVVCTATMPNISQKTIDVMQNINNFSESTISLETTIKCNEFWWVGKNGNLYFKSQKMGPRRYVYNRSYQIAVKAVKPIKNTAAGLSGASIILDVAEIAIDGEIKPSNIINTTVAVFALVPGCEWIPILYGLIDINVMIFTGKSIGDKANNYWGTIK